MTRPVTQPGNDGHGTQIQIFVSEASAATVGFLPLKDSWCKIELLLGYLAVQDNNQHNYPFSFPSQWLELGCYMSLMGYLQSFR